MSIAIKVENLSKQYRLGQIGTGTISHDLNRWWHRVRGNEDPYLKIGEANDRTQKGSSDYVWALQDINFEVKQGDAVGIIGRNGAGKSTLLKILSKTTAPTTGSIKIQGRIASLLEVGTGFHPELSGRDNIFLNGAILGMNKQEIKKKFDEIVDFSGVERYIDTPVKRYSSGMYVRLAFGVAAHLESEILIVDEVLAVGDAEFQKKCLGKMNDVSKGEGRTVLFVSHNMNSMIDLCSAGLLLSNGHVLERGFIREVVEKYIGLNNTSSAYSSVYNEDREVQVLSAFLENEKGEMASDFSYDQPVILKMQIKNKLKGKGIRYNVSLRNIYDTLLMVDSYYLTDLDEEIHFFKIIIPPHLLSPTSFKIGISIDIPRIELFENISDALSFTIIDTGSSVGKKGDTDIGVFLPQFIWHKL